MLAVMMTATMMLPDFYGGFFSYAENDAVTEESADGQTEDIGVKDPDGKSDGSAETEKASAEDAKETAGKEDKDSSKDKETKKANKKETKDPIELSFEGDDFDVSVSGDEKTGLTDETGLEVKEIKSGKKNSKEYKEYESLYNDSLDAVQSKKAVFAKFYDITLTDADGKEMEPSAPVDVEIKFADKLAKELKAEDAAKVSVIHFVKDEKTGEVSAEVLGTDDDANNNGVAVTDGESGKTEQISEAKNGETPVELTITDDQLQGVAFTSDNFSVYGIIYTVDFHYGDGEYDFSIAGESSIMLSEIFERLHIDDIDMADIESVEFSDPELIKVEQEDSDWLLTSLKPFDSEETLTIKLNEGSTITIGVTDERQKITRQQLDDAVSTPTTCPVRIEFADGTLYKEITVPSGRVSSYMPDLAKQVLGSRANYYYNNSVYVYQGNTQGVRAFWILNIDEEIYLDEQNRADSNAGRNSVISDINSTAAAAGVRYLQPGQTLVMRLNNNFVIKDNVVYKLNPNGTCQVFDSITETDGEPKIVHRYVEYNGVQYPLKDLYSYNREYLDGTDMILDDELIKDILGKDSYDVPDVVTEKPDTEDVTGYTPGNSNATSDYQLWKKVTKNDDNTLDIDLAFFKKMDNDTHLDFIFFIDETYTMSAEAQMFNKEINTVQRLITRSFISMAAQATLGKEGYDNRMAFVYQGVYGDKLYASTGVFHKNYTSTTDPYDTTKSAKADLFSHYASGATADVGPARDEVIRLAKKSKDEGRQPVVIIVSDFENGFTDVKGQVLQDDAASNGYEVYGMNVDDNLRETKMRRFVTKDAYMYHANNVNAFFDNFTLIFQDAIGYYVSNDTQVTDELSVAIKDKLVDPASLPQTDENGRLTREGDTVKWQFVDGNGNALTAGNVYRKKLVFDLGDSGYASNMPTNGECVTKKGDTVKNSIDSMKWNHDLTLTLGRLDESGNQTSDIIGGADFTIKIGTNTYNATTDAHGQITITADQMANMAPGATIVITQKTTDDMEDDTPKMALPSGPWTLTVASDYSLTPSSTGNDPAITKDSNTSLKLWNKQYVEVLPVLVPVTVEKKWIGGGETFDVPFTVYGVTDSDDRISLTAYDSPDRRNANPVTAITDSNKDSGSTAANWTKVVYVPESSGTNKFYKNENGTQSYNYEIEEGEVPEVENGYYTKGDETAIPTTEFKDAQAFVYEGGWKPYETTSSNTTKVELHLNVNDSKYGGIPIQGDDLHSNNAYNLVYKDLSKVYVEFTINSGNHHGQKAVLSATVDPVASHDRPGVQLQDIEMPKDWMPNGNLNNSKMARGFTVTKLVFVRTDGSRLTVYDSETNNPANDNYLNKVPRNDYLGYPLIFMENGVEEGYHAIYSTHPVSGSTKYYKESNLISDYSVRYNNLLTLGMTNTFTRTYKLSMDSDFADESRDSASTDDISSVTYTVKKGDWTGTYEASKDDTGHFHYDLVLEDAGSYTVYQSAYTLADGTVVRSDDDGKFAPFTTTDSPKVTVNLSDSNDEEDVAFTNTRDFYNANVRTEWVDRDSVDSITIHFKLHYGSEVQNGTNTTPDWETDYTSIPTYGIDGEKTNCEVVLDADLLALLKENNLVAEVTDYQENNTHYFVIKITVEWIPYIVSKTWQDAPLESGEAYPESVTAQVFEQAATQPFEYAVSDDADPSATDIVLDDVDYHDWSKTVYLPADKQFEFKETKIGNKSLTATDTKGYNVHVEAHNGIVQITNTRQTLPVSVYVCDNRAYDEWSPVASGAYLWSENSIGQEKTSETLAAECVTNFSVDIGDKTFATARVTKGSNDPVDVSKVKFDRDTDSGSYKWYYYANNAWTAFDDSDHLDVYYCPASAYVKVTKELPGEYDDRTAEYTFEVSGLEEGETVMKVVSENGTDTETALTGNKFKLKHNESIVLKIPAGKPIAIEETATTGYSTTITASMGSAGSATVDGQKVTVNITGRTTSTNAPEIKFSNTLTNTPVPSGLMITSGVLAGLLVVVLAVLYITVIRRRRRMHS